jgi:tetratricopeptide (TPR) repeat protein
MQQPVTELRFEIAPVCLRISKQTRWTLAVAALASSAMLLTPLTAYSQGQGPSSEQSPPTANTASFIESIDALRAQAKALIDAGKPAQALELVAAQEPVHGNDPEYDYLLGTIALAVGENTIAVNALERAVLVQPSFAGAWLDLAIAHFRLGEIEVADGILKHIEENFNPPQQLRAEIAEVRRKAARSQITKGWQTEFGAFSGSTSNANFGLAVSSLQLNLAGTPVSLILDPSYSPRADRFNEYRGTLNGRVDHPRNAHSEVYASLRHRGYDTESDQNQRDAIVSGTWHQPTHWLGLEGATLLGGVSARYLAYPGRNVSIAQLTGGLRFPISKCQLTARIDYEQRFFSSESAYDASIPWLSISSECAKGSFQFGGQQRIGFDSETNQRPGGNTFRAETIAFGRWQVNPNLQFGAATFYAYARDAEGFSPLLANGDRRWVHRFGQKLDAIWVPGENPRSPWAIVIEYENIRDRSNIGLSTLQINQFQVGLVYRHF